MKTKSIESRSNCTSSGSSASFVRIGVLATSLLASLMVASPASAASACKGLDNLACAASSSCGWVESYERKDGRTVKAFCRTKSGAKKQSTIKSQAAKQASQKEASTVAKNGA